MQQGQRSSLSTLPENISFDHGTTSSDAIVDSQMSWNSMQTSAQNRHRIPSSEASIQYLQHVSCEVRNAEWSLGETSTSVAQHQGDQNECKTENVWASCSRATLPLEELQHEPSNIPSLNDVDINLSGNQTTNGSFIFQNSGLALSQDLNMSTGLGDQEDDSFQVAERPSSYISVGSSNEMQSAGSSSTSSGGPSRCRAYATDNREDRPGCSLDGQRMSCKRKAFELHAGQSSGVGSSNRFLNAERSQWHAIPAAQNATSNINMLAPTGNDLFITNGSELENPRLGLGVGGAVSASPFSLTTPSGNAESSQRNFRLRVNGLHQQDPIAENPFSTEAGVGNAVASSSRNSSRSVRCNRFLDLNPPPAVENRSLHGQSAVRIPSVRRNHQSRWRRASSTRASSSSASAFPEDWNAGLHEEPTSRNIPRSISEHPMFIPASEMGNSFQNPINWNLVGGSNNIAGNIASSSRVGPSTGASYSAPNWSHRSYPQYPRRLSEIVRRSLLSSAGPEPGSQSSIQAIQPSSSTSQEMTLPSGSDNRRYRTPNSRSALLERHLEGAFGIPYSLRALAAAGEGGSNIMSEIRHVLDLMRRGDALRFEDVMILDHSVVLGTADIHDRHQDMRMDVDNMSYEELLALEERIGNVCTGLSEETIMSRLKQQKYVDNRVGQEETEPEPCSICREEYNAGEDLGKLECGHDFHRDCIKQWLLRKNLCPICKTTGLAT